MDTPPHDGWLWRRDMFSFAGRGIIVGSDGKDGYIMPALTNIAP
jgi:hypothetical protein